MKSAILFFLAIFLFSGCGGEMEEVETPPAPEGALVFAVVGDYGVPGAAESKVAKMVKSWNPEFIVTLGDNNYLEPTLDGFQQCVGRYYGDFIYNPDAPSGYHCKGKASKEKKNRFFPVPGNHDFADHGRDDSAYLSYFTLPGNELYYDFVWGDVHFFMLDSEKHGSDASCCSNEQAAWLKEKLENSTDKFKLVCFHHPPFSPIHRPTHEEMRLPFSEWTADAVLAGHDHVYAHIEDKTDPDFPYIINGLGGGSLYECNLVQLPPEFYDVNCYDQNFGAIRGVVEDDRLTLQFFQIENYVTPVDQVVLSKNMNEVSQ